MKNLRQKYIVILIFLLFFHLLLLLNTKFTVWPEMVLYPWFQTKGFILYKDIVNPYFPLLSLVLYWVFSFFGSSILTLKVFTWVLILVCDFVIFWTSLNLSKSFYRSYLAVFLWMVLQLSLGGNALWFELFLVPFIVSSLVLVYKDFNKQRSLFIAGLLMGLGVLIKQNSVIFYIPAILYLINKLSIKSIFNFLFPGILLGVLSLVYLLSFNIWNDFYFWAVNLTLHYTSQPGFVSLPAKRQYLLILFPATILIGILIKNNLKKVEKFYWTCCLILSLIFAFPRYEDFHLQLALALAALLSTLANKKILYLFLILSLVIFSINLPKNWQKTDRFIDKDTLELAEKISKMDTVYLLNSPDLAYFFAEKTPPKPWAINFPWYFEQEGFQKKFIEGLDKDTKYIVVGNKIGGEEFSLGNYYPKEVYQYIEQNYHFVEEYKSFKIWQKN